mmetsp:Transcript_1291/g.3968  ORF Transcript_1291/g.3968 Transcript_1291/m.3968 type:complete len:138 (+) Transcript_1291:478-891(+)
MLAGASLARQGRLAVSYDEEEATWRISSFRSCPSVVSWWVPRRRKSSSSAQIVYTGEFLHGRRSGTGQWTEAGRERAGEWVDGMLNGAGETQGLVLSSLMSSFRHRAEQGRHDCHRKLPVGSRAWSRSEDEQTQMWL